MRDEKLLFQVCNFSSFLNYSVNKIDKVYLLFVQQGYCAMKHILADLHCFLANQKIALQFFQRNWCCRNNLPKTNRTGMGFGHLFF